MLLGRKFLCSWEVVNIRHESISFNILIFHFRYYELVVPTYSEFRFLCKFRISRKTFKFLCDRLRPRLFKKETQFRKGISVGKQILIAISILKGKCDLWTIADLFGVGKSTVGHILQRFCVAFVEELYSEFVNFPADQNAIDELVKGFFNRWQFPSCFGALDGCHVEIEAPSGSPADYYNYKHFHSIVLLALVDFKYRFM